MKLRSVTIQLKAIEHSPVVLFVLLCMFVTQCSTNLLFLSRSLEVQAANTLPRVLCAGVGKGVTGRVG